jgi:hypothetical protein
MRLDAVLLRVLVSHDSESLSFIITDAVLLRVLVSH